MAAAKDLRKSEATGSQVKFGGMYRLLMHDFKSRSVDLNGSGSDRKNWSGRLSAISRLRDGPGARSWVREIAFQLPSKSVFGLALEKFESTTAVRLCGGGNPTATILRSVHQFR
jgi:hypothetical protein